MVSIYWTLSDEHATGFYFWRKRTDVPSGLGHSILTRDYCGP